MSADLCYTCDNNCLLKVLSDSDRKTLLQRATYVNYRKKEMLFKQGSFQTSLFLLKSGLVKTFMERRNDKNIILKIIAPNEIINLPSFFQPTYEFSAITLCNCEVCIIPLEDVRQVMGKKTRTWAIIFSGVFTYQQLPTSTHKNTGNQADAWPAGRCNFIPL